MKYGEYLEEQMKDPEFRKFLAQESLLGDITEEICRLMEEQDVSYEELAKRIKKNEDFIKRILGGGAKLTIPIIADVFTALGARLHVVAEEEDV